MVLAVGRKEGLLAYVMAAFFVFMTVWYGLRAFGNLPVFDGVWGYIFRGLLVVFLAVIVFIWWKSRKAAAENNDDNREQ